MDMKESDKILAWRDKEWIRALKDEGLVPTCFEMTDECTPQEVVKAMGTHIIKLVTGTGGKLP